ncbi:MAG: universal stress protein [Cyclobacteriaceae bacterium]|jgi:nucleotide-binding universal stress UspA family protein|nr:universal stress protein [Cyclobacteriaceae bacterium]MDH4298694.1 universal stress protein [Cyclobacteriaceae bacterium]
MTYSKILIAVDNSTFSFAAAKVGFDLARQLQAKVALVFVANKARIMHNADAGILPEEAMVMLRQEAKSTLEKLTALYAAQDVVTFMPEDEPADGIIKTAESWGADLMVMGTHGRTGLMHLLLGSVAEQVLRHSKIPTVVVPSK